MRTNLCLLLLSLALFANGQARQKTDSVLRAGGQTLLHDLAPYTAIYEDSAAKIPAGDMIAGRFDQRFVPLSSFDRPTESDRAYWLRFKVFLPGNSQWLLTLRDKLSTYEMERQNCYADLYLVDPGDGRLLAHLRSGIFVPLSERSVKDISGLNKFLLEGRDKTLMVYLRLYNNFNTSRTAIFPQIGDPSLPDPRRKHETLLEILIGIAAVFTILSLFFFFFVREKAYLFFAAFTFCLFQHYFILHPRIPFINWYVPEHPHLAEAFFTFLAFHSFIFLLWFGSSFINLRTLSPRLYRALKWFLFTWSFLVCVESVIIATTHQYVLSRIITFAFLPGMLFFIVRLAFFKNKLAYFYVAGAGWLFLFAVLGFLSNVGLSLPFNPWAISQAGQMIIYAAGLAYKVRLNEIARSEARRIQEMDEIKSRFFANISHEFRTPLALILGPLQQIEEQVSPGNQNGGSVTVPLRQVRTMRRNTDRLLELVNQLLDLSRLDSGKMRLRIIKGDIIQLLKALTGSFDSMAERKHIHYRVHLPGETQLGFFDDDKLQKIIVNLLSNAFKYTPERGTVSVTAEFDEQRLRLAVEDSGPGISKKELDRIFDRFYQVEGNEDKGSGIGLALVKELTDLYRGQITVSSEPGKGSKFRVSLPIAKDSFKDSELVYGEWKTEPVFINESGGAEEPAVHIANPGKPLVLIVEDNPDLRSFIREALQTDYQVTESVNGLEGFNSAVADIPDLVLSDVMMPVVNGFEMTKKLKSDERTSHIPVILLTAKAGQPHKVEGLETGADDYLTKPFDAKELLVRVTNLINQRKLLRKKFAGSVQLKPSEIAGNSLDEAFLGNVLSAIETHMDEDDFGVGELAKEVAMSRSQLHRKLVALVDKSPSDLIRQTRLLRAKELLQKKLATPSEVAFKVGFSSHTYFSKCFREEFGISPSEVNSQKFR